MRFDINRIRENMISKVAEIAIFNRKCEAYGCPRRLIAAAIEGSVSK
jgi:hypothetical protein